MARACNPALLARARGAARPYPTRPHDARHLPDRHARPGGREAILAGLLSFNEAQAGSHKPWPLAVLIGDPVTGHALGGLWGKTSFGWLLVELLSVPEALRGSGLGTSLVRRAEEEAVRRGCRGAWLDTFSFQARGFYERLGYAVFGTIQDYPPGHRRHFMQKTF